MNLKNKKKLAEFARVSVDERNNILYVNFYDESDGNSVYRWEPDLVAAQALQLLDEISYLDWEVTLVGKITNLHETWSCGFKKDDIEFFTLGTYLADTVTRGVWKALKKEKKIKK